MAEQKHTPLPWLFNSEPEWQPWEGSISVIGDGHVLAWTTSGFEEIANAALIVHAVNSHASLEARVKRLKEALSEIEGRDSHIDATPRGNREVIRGPFAQIAAAALKDIPDAGEVL